MKHFAEMASGGMIYILFFWMMGSGIQLRLLTQQSEGRSVVITEGRNLYSSQYVTHMTFYDD
jgi:hypothetical protein